MDVQISEGIGRIVGICEFFVGIQIVVFIIEGYFYFGINPLLPCRLCCRFYTNQ